MNKLKNKSQMIIIVSSFLIILISLIALVIAKSYAIYKLEKDYDVIKSVIGDFRGSIVNYKYYIDDTEVADMPSKDQYKYVSNSCDNANGTFDANDWSFKISDATTRVVNCSITFTKINNLYELVKSQSLGLDTVVGLDYDKISSDSNGKGVYSTTNTDSGKEVYFYRGDVNNNNVLFGGFCWKIVRTTETGGVKLIYNGKADNQCLSIENNDTYISKGHYNETTGDNANVGYMYGDLNASNYEDTHKNINNSTIKNIIDSWYENNLINYSSYIEDSVYCNDRSTIKYDATKILNFTNYSDLGYGTTSTLYAASARGWSNSKKTDPTLKCINNNDKFTVSSDIGNGNLTYPIATITIDEILYAGLNAGYAIKQQEAVNTNFYLYNNITYWTMTPIASRSNYTGIARMRNDGHTDYNATNQYYAIRPVITLKNNTKITGKGMQGEPYIIEY